MSQAEAWLRTLPPIVIAAVVAFATSMITTLLTPVIKYSFDQRLEARKLDLQYRAEQQKALRDRLARYRGLFLQSAEALNERFWDFYRREPQR